MVKKGDKLIVLFFAFLIAILFCSRILYSNFSAEVGHTALIIQDGKVLHSIELGAVSKTEFVRVDGKYKHIIQVETGKIRFSEADCPDKVCVRTGWLKDPGDIAVCIPDKIIIKVEGHKDNVDSFSY